MAHVGLICDPGPSHVLAMTAIGRQLRERGHRITLFSFGDFEDPSLVSDFDVQFHTSADDLTRQRASWISQARSLKREDYLRFTILRARTVLTHAPSMLRGAQLDCVLVDAIDPASATVAEALGLPFVTINNALPLNHEASVPPDFIPWRYHDAVWARLRNWLAYRVRDVIIRPLHKVLNEHRTTYKLKPYRTPNDSFSPYAQITQLIPEFDYPRKCLPAAFHYVGPYRRAASAAVEFPYGRLDGRPLIYASLGTIQGSRQYLWEAITSACSDMDAQLVLTLGKCDVPLQARAWPGNPIVVTHAPQIELLQRASLAILHGGLNSAMEALAAGVPIVTIPIIGDQFGVAARVAYTGVGEAIPAAACRPEPLHKLIHAVRHNPRYGERARHLQSIIKGSKGAEAAAAIISDLVENKRAS